MTSQKCTTCGLVSWADTSTCKRCGASLLDQNHSDIRPTQENRSKRTTAADIISCTLLLIGVCCIGFKDRLGTFSYLYAMLAFVLGLGYSFVRIFRSTRRPPRDRKRDALTVLVINGLMVMVFGAAVPIVFLSNLPRAKPFEWREYSSITGNYKIQLPDKPEETREQVQSPNGPLTLNRMTTNMGQGGVFTSAFYDIWDRKVIVSDEDLLDRVLQDRMADRTCVLLWKRPFIITPANGATINALEAELQIDKDVTSLLRVYWVKEKSMIYMNKVTFIRSKRNLELAEKFLNSFQLTGQ